MARHHPHGRSDTPEPSLAAIVEAGHTGERGVVDDGLAATDPALRAAALGALLRLGALTAAVLADHADDPDPTVRRRAAELAPRLPDPAGTESFLRRALDDEPTIAEMAAFSLGEVGATEGVELDPATIAALEDRAISHSDALVREAAVAALGALHTGLDTILAALGDKATVRRRAVIALAPFDGAEVDAALRTALDDRDWQVRQAAEDLLAISDESDPS